MQETDWRPDLSKAEERRRLSPRKAPYFNLLQYCRHIGLQVDSAEAARWVARVRKCDGGYRQKVLGPETPKDAAAMTYEDALAAANAWFATEEVRTVASEPYQIGSKRELNICPVGNTYTVGHALQDYLSWKLLAATKSHYETLVSLMNYHIVPRLSGVVLEEFNGSHFHAFAKSVLETPPKKNRKDPIGRTSIQQLPAEDLRKRKKTLNALVSILRGAFEIAWEHGKLDTDRPMRCLRRVPNVDRPRIVFLDRGECQRLLQASGGGLEDLVAGALYTGCRATELTLMLVGDVNLPQGAVFVASPKGRRTRHVMLPPEGLKFFTKLSAGRPSTERLFLKANGRAWGSEYKSYFQKARDKSGLPKTLTFHGLRHTYASQLVQAGASLIAVAEQLGHANTQTVSATYGHLGPKHRSAEVARFFAPLSYNECRNTPAIVAREQGIEQIAVQESDAHHSWPRSNFSKLNGRTLADLKQ